MSARDRFTRSRAGYNRVEREVYTLGAFGRAVSSRGRGTSARGWRGRNTRRRAALNRDGRVYTHRTERSDTKTQWNEVQVRSVSCGMIMQRK